MTHTLQHRLQQTFPDLVFESEVLLAPFTAIKIGGPAEVLVAIESTTQLATVLKFCEQEGIPVTILGWGANTLIADRGLRGLVIRNLTKELVIEAKSEAAGQLPPVLSARHQAITPDQDFTTLDYQEESNAPTVVITAASGWPLPSLIATLLTQGITGLQWYARIPATLGGAIVNNIHGGTHFLSENVESVRVLNPAGEERQLVGGECDFRYDYSRFHVSGEVILDARLQLWRGNVERARKTVSDWATKKSIQPQKSLGCTFQNISTQEQERLGLPTNSTGYLIDTVLQLKGTQVGGARVSTQHAAFIENVGNATAQDYLSLATMIHTKAQQELALVLKPEIFFKGFASDEIAQLVAAAPSVALIETPRSSSNSL